MKNITEIFLRGLFVIVPVLITFAFIYWLFETAEQLFRIPLELILPEGWYLRGMGLVSALLFTLLVGVLMKVYAINLLFTGLEKVMHRLPLVKQIYGSIRDLIHFIGGSDRDDLQKVVALEINGMKLIGFVTSENATIGNDGLEVGDEGKEKLLSVYLPMSYQVGGYLVYVAESRCETLDMPVQDAMKTVLTANISGSRD